MQWKERARNGTATAFQADDEGSIPFTRSNILKHLRRLSDFILTRLLPFFGNLLLLGEAQGAAHRGRKDQDSLVKFVARYAFAPNIFQ